MVLIIMTATSKCSVNGWIGLKTTLENLYKIRLRLLVGMRQVADCHQLQEEHMVQMHQLKARDISTTQNTGKMENLSD